MRKIASHSYRTDEKWTLRRNRRSPLVVQKATVRVAKGDPSGRGGQFHGATNLRGSVLG